MTGIQLAIEFRGRHAPPTPLSVRERTLLAYASSHPGEHQASGRWGTGRASDSSQAAVAKRLQQRGYLIARALGPGAALISATEAGRNAAARLGLDCPCDACRKQNR